VYDADTRALILNDQKIADRSSRMDLRKNDDGCVDIYCGPKVPAGFEQNWIPTVPGKTGSRISASTGRPSPTSIGPGSYRTSSDSRTSGAIESEPHRRGA